jgi:hypothetical protein
MELTRAPDAKFVSVHELTPRKLIISPRNFAELSQLLKKLTSVPQSYIRSLTLDFSDYARCTSYASLSEREMVVIAQALKRNFPNLRDLSINTSWVRITPSGYQALATALSQLKALSKLKLNFHFAHESTQSLYYLAQSIKKVSNLTKLGITFAEDLGSRINSAVLTKLSQSIKHKICLADLSFTFVSCPSLLGDGINSLINSLQQLTQLKKLELDFANTSMSQHNLTNLATSFKQLKQLIDLKLRYLGHLNFTDKSWQEISQGIASLDTLTRLELNLGGGLPLQQLKNMGIILKQLPQLTELKLVLWGNQQLNDESWPIIEQGLVRLANLTSLDLDLGSSSSKIDLSCIATIVKQLPHLTSVRLNFCYNPQLTNNSLSEIAHSIASLSQLDELELVVSYCSALTDQGVVALSHAIHNLSLRSLKLDFSYSDNLKLANPTLTELARSVSTLAKLEKFYIDIGLCKGLDEKGITEVAMSIGHLQSLTKLTLRLNSSITDPILKQLGTSLSQLKRIEQLAMHLGTSELITEQGIDYLANNLKNLPELAQLKMTIFTTDNVAQRSELKLYHVLSKLKKQPIKAEINIF